MKTALVTGGSSGIGRCTAAALRNAGFAVYEFSRRDAPQDGIKHISVDVTDEDAVQKAVEKIISEAGGIDVVVNCAGFGISGAVEFTPLDQAKAQFDVNFFGTVNVNKAVLPFMREAGKGHIINISSVAAAAHIPFQAFYSASKAAISSYSCALDNEVKPYGIQVTTVGDKEYGGRISRSVSQMEKDEQNGASPEVIGAYIAKIAEKKCKPICVAGAQYKFLSLLCKLLPCGLRGKIVGAIYAK